MATCWPGVQAEVSTRNLDGIAAVGVAAFDAVAAPAGAGVLRQGRVAGGGGAVGDLGHRGGDAGQEALDLGVPPGPAGALPPRREHLVAG
jgi:hypothetical protein